MKEVSPFKRICPQCGKELFYTTNCNCVTAKRLNQPCKSCSHKPKRSIAERFAQNVIKTQNCWLWIGHQTHLGYGRMVTNHFGELAHRIAWTMYKDKIPDGMFVCHKCDNPQCVNPDHLFLGTQRDNIHDAMNKGRTARGVKNRNHKFTEIQVADIRSSIEQTKLLAKRYNVSERAIRDIRNNVSWKHIKCLPPNSDN